MHFEKIKNIKYIGQIPTLDIEVDNEQHEFYANNIVVSNSHSISYALTSYFSAYQKCHFPTEFYCAWLTFSNEKPEPRQEIYELVIDAKLNKIEVLPPSVKVCNIDFEILEPRKILFGLRHIKGLGIKSANTVKKYQKSLQTWKSFLKSVSKIKRNIAESLIKSGGCDFYNLPRMQMIKELYVLYGASQAQNNAIKPLSPIELKYFFQKSDEMQIVDILQLILDNKICMSRRREIIENKIIYLQENMQDSYKQRAIFEKIYLGLNLSCSIVDDINTGGALQENCRTVFHSRPETKFIIYVVIDKIQNKKTSQKAKKPNQEYCYLLVSDNTGGLNNCVVWPIQYEKHKDLIYEGSVVALYGYKNIWKGREQLIINTIAEVK